jgi:hypothetical protein
MKSPTLLLFSDFISYSLGFFRAYLASKGCVRTLRVPCPEDSIWRILTAGFHLLTMVVGKSSRGYEVLSLEVYAVWDFGSGCLCFREHLQDSTVSRCTCVMWLLNVHPMGVRCWGQGSSFAGLQGRFYVKIVQGSLAAGGWFRVVSDVCASLMARSMHWQCKPVLWQPRQFK